MPDERAPGFIVHTLAHAIAALTAAGEANRAVVLLSPAEAVRSMGTGYFLTMIAAARAAVPAASSRAVLDCGRAPGLALAALKAGVEAVRIDASPEVIDKLADIAAQRGASIDTRWPASVVDLGRLPAPLEAARHVLKG